MASNKRLIASGASAGGVVNTENFDIVTYTGSNQESSRSISSLNFQPDLIMHKVRNDSWPMFVYDSIRGAGTETELTTTSSDTIGAYNNQAYGYLSSFDSNGFTSGVGTAFPNDNQYFNKSGATFVTYCFKGGGTSSTNSNGTISANVSANPNAGFSIGTYTGNSTAGATIGHGLGGVPDFIIVKLVSGLSPKAWTVYHKDMGNTDYLYLNTTGGQNTYNFWNNTSPTSSVFSVSSDTNVNSSSGNYVFYAFRSIDGYQKFGRYSGNSSVQAITTGFQPRFLVIKSLTTSTGNWFIYDAARDTSDPRQNQLEFDTGTVETNHGAVYSVDFQTNGFELNGAGGEVNYTGRDYIYWAIA